LNPEWYEQALRVATALAAGILIGIERGWKLKDEKPGSRVAGVRTFSMLGLGGGIAGLLGALSQPIAAGALAVGAVAVMVAAFSPQLKSHHDSTTAVAALVTIAIGFLAGSGSAGPHSPRPLSSRLPSGMTGRGPRRWCFWPLTCHRICCATP